MVQLNIAALECSNEKIVVFDYNLILRFIRVLSYLYILMYYVSMISRF